MNEFIRCVNDGTMRKTYRMEEANSEMVTESVCITCAYAPNNVGLRSVAVWFFLNIRKQ